MNFTGRKISLALASAVICMGSAQAAGVNSVDFVSTSGVRGVSSTTPCTQVALSTATGMCFDEAASGPYSGYNAFTQNAQGVFASIDGLGAIYKDFMFSPSGAPISAFITVGTLGVSPLSPSWTFDLTSITAANYDSGTKTRSFAGKGTIKYDGIEYESDWSFSAQSVNDTTSGRFSFSSNLTEVPLPGTVALLGLGMLGLGASGVARRRTSTSALPTV